jgi:hypothetical protein
MDEDVARAALAEIVADDINEATPSDLRISSKRVMVYSHEFQEAVHEHAAEEIMCVGL